MHVAPGAASDSCNFPQPTVFIFSMAGCGIPCEAMLHVFTSACEQNLRASSCMPLRAHVHLICVAICFTILHPLHPSSSIVAFATCPNLTPMSVVCGMLFFRSIGFSYLYYACCFIISLMGWKLLFLISKSSVTSQKPTPLCIDRALVDKAWASAIGLPHMLGGKEKSSRKSTTYGLQIPSWKKTHIPKLRGGDMEKMLSHVKHKWDGPLFSMVAYLLILPGSTRIRRSILQTNRKRKNNFKLLGINQAWRTTNHMYTSRELAAVSTR